MRPSFAIFFHYVLLCITKVNPMPSFNSLAKPYLEVLDNMIDEEKRRWKTKKMKKERMIKRNKRKAKKNKRKAKKNKAMKMKTSTNCY